MKYYKDENKKIYFGIKNNLLDVELSNDEIIDYLKSLPIENRMSATLERLHNIDNERIRSIAEINNPDILEKSYAIKKLKDLEIEAESLRKVIK